MYPFDHPMTKSDDGIDFIMPISDTVFNFDKGVTKPKFLIETPSKIAPKNILKLILKILITICYMNILKRLFPRI